MRLYKSSIHYVPLYSLRYIFLFAYSLFHPVITLSDTVDETVSLKFIPTRFSEDRPLEKYIKFPKSDENVDVIILCDVNITERGVYRSNYCLTEGEAKKYYERAVHKATRYARNIPARVDGVLRSVRFQYSVQFIKEGDNQQIITRPNHRESINVTKYGVNYSGVQKYFVKADRPPSSCNSANLWLAMDINIEGIPENITVLEGEGSEMCKEHIKEFMAKSLFIPAVHEGKYVPSTYIELFFTFNKVRRLL